ncbi:acyltransferase family protein [Tamlana sp. s12]|uniref:acyltransferase family protein n=1 Tax=Tamlana sp. s12 TaxID=1630406 RepID=UPI0007FD587D|nr:acyltransferase family protein [Tamlana sp. s12]OBQ46011.1 2,3,4,5-tetrahydropyridine-2,6-carboxylate N-succinyltransferase [Tamlana sp. s12]QQY81573.1 acyltransferase family protein [Tamlana sp. s12]
MKTKPHKTERIHSLDSLRAIMMLLGLVIHSAITYGVIEYGSWSIKDALATHLSNDFIVSFIHAFRMQIFFIVAGFFGAMLFYERQPLKMVKNRISRIVIPFIVFVLLLWPFIVFSFGFTKLLFEGSNNPLSEALAPFSNIEILIPGRTFHLWFLYYLAIITFVSVGLGLLFKKLPSISNHISNSFSWIIQKPLLRILIFAGLTAIVYFIMGTSSVATSTSFILDFNTFIYYFIFYMVGWVLFKSKHLLGTMMHFDWISTVLGITLFTVHFFNYDAFNYETHIILKSIMIWLFAFGIMGLFIRFGSNHSATMRYVSDSSYWVYLIHLPLTAIIPSFIYDWPLPATVKFLLVLISTGIICFVSYHFLVRGTFIGNFLNGRKYSRKLSDIKKAEELSKLKRALDK